MQRTSYFHIMIIVRIGSWDTIDRSGMFVALIILVNRAVVYVVWANSECWHIVWPVMMIVGFHCKNERITNESRYLTNANGKHKVIEQQNQCQPTNSMQWNGIKLNYPSKFEKNEIVTIQMQYSFYWKCDWIHEDLFVHKIAMKYYVVQDIGKFPSMAQTKNDLKIYSKILKTRCETSKWR